MADRAELPSPLERNVTWRTLQLVMQGLFCFLLGYRARGLEKLPPGGALLIVNHQSYLDPMLVGLPLERPISFLARSNLFNAPVVGWILKNTYVMPIDQAAASTGSFREMVRRLKHGYYVGIFPEGTRTETGEIGVIKPGFLAVVRRAGVPVIPVGIAGAFESYPLHASFPRPGRVRVIFGESIPPEWFTEEGNDESDLLERIRDRMVALQTEAQNWRDQR